MTAREKILEALTKAAADGMAFSDLLKLAPPRGIEKALIAGRRNGLWYSNGRKNNRTRYYIDQADMQKAVAAERQKDRQLKRDKENAKYRAKRASAPKAKPVKAAAPKAPKKTACQSLPAARKSQPKPDQFKLAPPTNPHNVKPVQLPGCKVERFKATGDELFFSSLSVGNYLRSDSAISRAYA